jgi:hypothetical protein
MTLTAPSAQGGPYDHIDVIVMTTHGRSGREKEMFGSVAEAVVRGVTVPVFLVSPTGLVVRTPPREAAPLLADP